MESSSKNTILDTDRYPPVRQPPSREEKSCCRICAIVISTIVLSILIPLGLNFALSHLTALGFGAKLGIAIATAVVMLPIPWLGAYIAMRRENNRRAPFDENLALDSGHQNLQKNLNNVPNIKDEDLFAETLKLESESSKNLNKVVSEASETLDLFEKKQLLVLTLKVHPDLFRQNLECLALAKSKQLKENDIAILKPIKMLEGIENLFVEQTGGEISAGAQNFVEQSIDCLCANVNIELARSIITSDDKHEVSLLSLAWQAELDNDYLKKLRNIYLVLELSIPEDALELVDDKTSFPKSIDNQKHIDAVIGMGEQDENSVRNPWEHKSIRPKKNQLSYYQYEGSKSWTLAINDGTSIYFPPTFKTKKELLEYIDNDKVYSNYTNLTELFYQMKLIKKKNNLYTLLAQEKDYWVGNIEVRKKPYFLVIFRNGKRLSTDYYTSDQERELAFIEGTYSPNKGYNCKYSQNI